MLIATITATLLLLALSFVQLYRWNEDRNAACQRQDDTYFVPSLIAYSVFAMPTMGSVILICLAANQSVSSLYGWVYYVTAVLCAGLSLAAALDARRTFIKIDGDEMVIQSFARRRIVRISDIERVRRLNGAIVVRLRSGHVLLASNVLGWNVALRTKLDLLGL